MVINMDIMVQKGMEEKRISCLQGESILEMLLRNNMAVSAVCGGNGTCGKCKIRILEGELPATMADRSFFSEEECKKGYRLDVKLIQRNRVKYKYLMIGKKNLLFSPTSKMKRKKT